MMLAFKKPMALLAIIALLLSTSLASASAQEPSPTYSYNMTFDKNGFTTIEIVYDSGLSGAGSSWVVVPKNSTSEIAITTQGTVTSMTRAPYRVGEDRATHPFYDNLTFTYDSQGEPFSMRIMFNMTEGAMIVEPNGFFYSPQIAVPSTGRVQATLTLPDGVNDLTEVVPTPTRVERFGSQTRLLFSPDSESRIALTFTVTWPKQTSHVREDLVEAEVPTRYVDLAERMAALYRNAAPLMDELFNQAADRISMKFFVPLSLPQLGIGGYTPIDPSTFQAGTIYLNLFYFRAVPGTMETIAIHELTHQYEARAGISADLLWVHEGLANYVAGQLGKQLGYDVTSTDAELEAAAAPLSGKYGIIQDWRPGTTVTSLFLYYAASYEIFKTLGDQYGGLPMYSRFFRGLRDLEGGLKSTNMVILRLSLAADTDLVPAFKEWGFEVVDLSNLNAQITRLRTETEWYGPLLPFRDTAISHLTQAEASLQSAPEVSMAHAQIAAFYIETLPMIIGGVTILLILLVAAALVIRRRSRKEPSIFAY